MRVGSLVQSNVDGAFGIVTETRNCEEGGWIRKRFRVQFPEGLMWLSSQVLEEIKHVS
jgi:hypothetical protein